MSKNLKRTSCNLENIEDIVVYTKKLKINHNSKKQKLNNKSNIYNTKSVLFHKIIEHNKLYKNLFNQINTKLDKLNTISHILLVWGF